MLGVGNLNQSQAESLAGRRCWHVTTTVHALVDYYLSLETTALLVIPFARPCGLALGGIR